MAWWTTHRTLHKLRQRLLQTLQFWRPFWRQLWRPFWHHRRGYRFPLRLVLVVPFLLQLFVVVSLTGYLSLQNGQKAVNDLVTQRNAEVSDRVLQHLDAFTQNSRRVAQITQGEIATGRMSVKDSRSFLSFLWQQATTYEIGFLLYGDRQGQLLGAGHHFNDGSISVIEANPQKYKSQDLYVYRADAQGYPQTQGDRIPNYRFQSEDWFAKTLRLGRSNWSNIYNWQAKPYPLAVAASVPLRDRSGQIIGSIAAESQLSEISQFLRNLRFSQAGRVFILERSGLLVANSNASPPFTIDNDIPKRLMGTESPDGLIQAAAKYLQLHFPTLQTIQQPQALTFMQGSERQFLKVVPWWDDWGLDWLVVVVVPESTFMDQIQDNTRQTIILCLIALGIATVIGLYTSHWIVRPILQLSQASQRIAIGNFNLTSASPASLISEVHTLGRSFDQMAGQIQDSFLALEQTNSQLEIRIAERTADLQNALAKLNQTQAQMIQSEKMSAMGQMVAGIAHEINNPASFIQGNIGPAEAYGQDLLDLVALYQQAYPHSTPEIQAMIEQMDLDFVQHDFPRLLRSMQAGTERIAEIIMLLRTFSRLDESDVKVVNLHEGLDSTLMMLQHRLQANAQRPAIQILRQYDPIPAIECHAGQLNQVFFNLLNNAIDAVEFSNADRSYQAILAQPNWIAITTRLVAEDKLQITIMDNGIGIPVEQQSQIFNPFYTTKPIGQGTGLGLAVSYQIITEAHHGELICRSKVREGSEFCIQLPISGGAKSLIPTPEIPRF